MLFLSLSLLFCRARRNITYLPGDVLISLENSDYNDLGVVIIGHRVSIRKALRTLLVAQDGATPTTEGMYGFSPIGLRCPLHLCSN